MFRAGLAVRQPEDSGLEQDGALPSASPVWCRSGRGAQRTVSSTIRAPGAWMEVLWRDTIAGDRASLEVPNSETHSLHTVELLVSTPHSAAWRMASNTMRQLVPSRRAVSGRPSTFAEAREEPDARRRDGRLARRPGHRRDDDAASTSTRRTAQRSAGMLHTRERLEPALGQTIPGYNRAFVA